MNDIDIARLAVLIDTEGCVLITRPASDGARKGGYKNGRFYHQLRIIISNNDLGLMKWLKDHFGGYIGKQSKSASKLSRKQCFYWVVHSKAAEDLLRFCLPYFLVKRKQAEVALIFRDTFTKSRGRRGFGEGEVAVREELRKQLSEMKR